MISAKSIPALSQAMASDDPKVRFAAEKIFVRLGPEARAAIPAVLRGFADPAITDSLVELAKGPR